MAGDLAKSIFAVSASGSSTDPCHDTYHGPSAFSEPETVAVRDFVEANKPEAFITLHSYSQMWLVPYGHRKRSYPQDYHTALLPLAQKATKALYDVFGTKYQVGTGADLMYEASGGSHDWAKGVLKVNYAYLIELRPQNTAAGFGFLLPEREIPATGLETFEAIKVVAEEMVAQFVEPEIRRRVRPSERPCEYSIGANALRIVIIFTHHPRCQNVVDTRLLALSSKASQGVLLLLRQQQQQQCPPSLPQKKLPYLPPPPFPWNCRVLLPPQHQNRRSKSALTSAIIVVFGLF
ncbi:unnamed protein product [Nippostrongylus brasiliensis]|uniref:Peptidase_M14 domain-containing protein n=1 Tax=Nippostrongylus brasiliensis TaxID=27835 RepID=A0A0N4YSY9_NIPBR|nr:unnamed protein product [Nippostrongylus brasiliensis]